MSTLESRLGLPRAADEILVSDTEFGLFQEYFYRRTGIVFGPTKRFFVERRLAARMSTRSALSVRNYLAMLKYEDPAGSEFQVPR